MYKLCVRYFQRTKHNSQRDFLVVQTRSRYISKKDLIMVEAMPNELEAYDYSKICSYVHMNIRIYFYLFKIADLAGVYIPLYYIQYIS